MEQAKNFKSKEFPVSHDNRSVLHVTNDFKILIKAVTISEKVTMFEALTKLVRMGYEAYLQRKSLN